MIGKVVKDMGKNTDRLDADTIRICTIISEINNPSTHSLDTSKKIDAKTAQVICPPRLVVGKATEQTASDTEAVPHWEESDEG